MPMNTTLRSGAWPEVGSAQRSDAICTCRTISDACNPRRSPSVAVAQNAQPIAQPTCDETQNVVRGPSGISTPSTRAPSCNAKTKRSVPSTSRRRASQTVSQAGNAASQRARWISLIAENAPAGRPFFCRCTNRRSAWPAGTPAAARAGPSAAR